MKMPSPEASAYTTLRHCIPRHGLGIIGFRVEGLGFRGLGLGYQHVGYLRVLGVTYKSDLQEPLQTR